eukprot:8030202-Pyramimonas_sp.AAC.1
MAAAAVGWNALAPRSTSGRAASGSGPRTCQCACRSIVHLGGEGESRRRPQGLNWMGPENNCQAGGQEQIPSKSVPGSIAGPTWRSLSTAT